MVSLYLDGINDLTQKLEEYDMDISTGCNLKKDVWLRITVIAHTVLTLIRTVALQLLRGIGNSAGGVIYLDKERVKMGNRDYLSLLIQVVSLPFLGLLTFFMPKTGYQLLHNFRTACDTERQAQDIVYKHEENRKKACYATRKKMCDGLMASLGTVSLFFQTTTQVVESLLSLNPGEACETIADSKRNFSKCWNKPPERDVFAAHRIAIESFNPSALL